MNIDKLYMVVAGTLATIMLAVVVVLLVGLFNPLVDNKEILSIIGPAFQTVVGAFVGLLSGKALGIGRDK